jgi:hypothetical protein
MQLIGTMSASILHPTAQRVISPAARRNEATVAVSTEVWGKRKRALNCRYQTK